MPATPVIAQKKPSSESYTPIAPGHLALDEHTQQGYCLTIGKPVA
jgi:hypothetical protein